MTQFEVMLSGKCPKDLKKVEYPVLVSPKLDGIRCIILNGVAYSRTLKRIPNLYVQDYCSNLPNGLDGELIVGNPTDPNVFNITQSGVMSEHGKPDFTFHVFDMYSNTNEQFKNRFENACAKLTVFSGRENNKCIKVLHFKIENAVQLQECADYYVGLGYEGVMIRSLDGPYKFGRSTEKQGYLLKYKPFQDADAIIIGVEELMHNNNEAIEDKFGRTKRTSHKANLIPGNKMGKLVCHMVQNDKVEFEIGTGFTDEMRNVLWVDRDKLIGKKIKFKYQNITAKGKPRLPVFLAFRED
jgi:DNA ligase-1